MVEEGQRVGHTPPLINGNQKESPPTTGGEGEGVEEGGDSGVAMYQRAPRLIMEVNREPVTAITLDDLDTNLVSTTSIFANFFMGRIP